MSNSIKIIKQGITSLNVDCIVNAANSGLRVGGGVCGAIFGDAGYFELTDACNQIGGCEEGSAVITPGFKLKAKYIIHAVGPVWTDRNHGEPQKLYSCYRAAMRLAEENGCHSIGFPLISAGIFGYPKREAWRKALQAISDYFKKHPECDIAVTFAVIDDSILAMGEEVMKELGLE